MARSSRRTSRLWKREGFALVAPATFFVRGVCVRTGSMTARALGKFFSAFVRLPENRTQETLAYTFSQRQFL